MVCSFFFNDTATTEIYTLSLHDALPICRELAGTVGLDPLCFKAECVKSLIEITTPPSPDLMNLDRKSTRLNSSHANISYAVFCLKKNKIEPLSLYAAAYCIFRVIRPSTA